MKDIEGSVLGNAILLSDVSPGLPRPEVHRATVHFNLVLLKIIEVTAERKEGLMIEIMNQSGGQRKKNKRKGNNGQIKKLSIFHQLIKALFKH